MARLTKVMKAMLSLSAIFATLSIYHFNDSMGFFYPQLIGTDFFQYSQYEEQNYTWIGDHWIPPEGVPTYTPSDVKEIWKNFDVLFVGDSTSRQDWGTVKAILESDDLNLEALHRDINFNKRMDEMCEIRDYSSRATLFYQMSYHHSSTGMNCANILLPRKKHRKLDQVRSNCLRDLVLLEQLEVGRNGMNITITKLSDEYNLIIIKLGIWDIMKPNDCGRRRHPLNYYLDNALDVLKNIASPKLKIIFETASRNNLYNTNMTEENHDTNERIREWFKRERPENLYLVDWSRHIFPRSFGNDRIHGDLNPHWGWQARIFNTQLLTHELKLLND